MRRLGTLDDAEVARRFAVALRDRGIKAEFRSEPEGRIAVWVVEEDQMTSAREEFDAFVENPTAERFNPPADEPTEIHPPAEATPIRSVRGGRSVWKRAPVTIALVVASVLVTFGSDFGNVQSPISNALSIASYEIDGNSALWNGLTDIRSGQVWRLFTPILLHGSLIHLLGNLGGLWVLGGAVESVRGSVRYLAAVLVIAAASNFAEYWLDLGLTFDAQRGFQTNSGIHPDPLFLGMSGVVFGLFGLIWMRARFVPRSRLLMPRDLVIWMLIWFFACTTGLVGNIANVAHGVGLLTGMAIGIAPRLWRRVY